MAKLNVPETKYSSDCFGYIIFKSSKMSPTRPKTNPTIISKFMFVLVVAFIAKVALKINDIDAEIFKIKDAMLAFELLNQLNKIAKTMLAPPNKYAPIITIPPIHQKSLQYL